MPVERLLGPRSAVVGDGLVQDRPVGGLLEVGGHRQDQPQRVVVEAGPDGVVPPLGQGLVLVVGASRGQLGRGEVEDATPGPVRDHVDEAQQILVRVAESHAPPGARLEQRRRAGQVEGDHALVGVPDVDHAVGVRAGGAHPQAPQERRPVIAERAEGLGDPLRSEVAGDRRPRVPGVDRARSGRVELRLRRVLRVAQHEHDLPGLPRGECQVDPVRPAGSPAVGDRVARASRLHRHRPLPPPVRAEEPVAVGVEARHLLRTGEVGEVVAALPVFGGVEDDAVLDHDLTDGQVALQVVGVVDRVPQAELHRREQRERPRAHRGGW